LYIHLFGVARGLARQGRQVEGVPGVVAPPPDLPGVAPGMVPTHFPKNSKKNLFFFRIPRDAVTP